MDWNNLQYLELKNTYLQLSENNLYAKKTVFSRKLIKVNLFSYTDFELAI